MARYATKAHYLDASALVKLVADDPAEVPGRDALRKYYSKYSNMYATSYSVTETLSALKRKYMRREIDRGEYIKYVRDFLLRVVGGNLKIDEVNVLKMPVMIEAERLIKKYGIDFLDSLQIVTILNGRFRVLSNDSKSVLITADEDLAKAASEEGARVWLCTSEPSPG